MCVCVAGASVVERVACVCVCVLPTLQPGFIQPGLRTARSSAAIGRGGGGEGGRGRGFVEKERKEEKKRQEEHE